MSIATDRIAARVPGLTKSQVDAVLAALGEVVAELPTDGKPSDVRLRVAGLGTFHATQRPARTARNPQTGETVEVAAKRVVKFKQ